MYSNLVYRILFSEEWKTLHALALAFGLESGQSFQNAGFFRLSMKERFDVYLL